MLARMLDTKFVIYTRVCVGFFLSLMCTLPLESFETSRPIFVSELRELNIGIYATKNQQDINILKIVSCKMHVQLKDLLTYDKYRM